MPRVVWVKCMEELIIRIFELAIANGWTANQQKILGGAQGRMHRLVIKYTDCTVFWVQYGSRRSREGGWELQCRRNFKPCQWLPKAIPKKIAIWIFWDLYDSYRWCISYVPFDIIITHVRKTIYLSVIFKCKMDVSNCQNPFSLLQPAVWIDVVIHLIIVPRPLSNAKKSIILL